MFVAAFSSQGNLVVSVGARKVVCYDIVYRVHVSSCVYPVVLMLFIGGFICNLFIL